MMHTRFFNVMVKSAGLAASLLLGGCLLSDGSELIPKEGQTTAGEHINVSKGLIPTYTWDVGAVSSLQILRKGGISPVWGLSSIVESIASPVTHGTPPPGLTASPNIEPTLTDGVAYEIRITRLSEAGKQYTAEFTATANTSAGLALSFVQRDDNTVSAGTEHSLAANSGTLQAWGGNTRGQLGDGTARDGLSPEIVGGLDPVRALASGGAHSAAVTAGGAVWTWGANAQGQLGNGSTGDSAVPVRVEGLPAITAVAAGEQHTLALAADGTVWAWGGNASGQLGDGTASSHLLPAQVPGLTGITAIAAGEFHSLAAAANGEVWAWGGNYRGQLGTGTTGNAARPVRVK